MYEIGHARRGQFYYLIISKESRTLTIYTSEPDGSGGSVICPNILVKMALDGLFEL